MGRKIRCLLAGNHLLLRQGIRRLLQDEPDIAVVGEAEGAAECLRKVGELRPDVLVADSALFDEEGSPIEQLVTRESAQTGVVFLNSGEEHRDSSHAGSVSCMARHTSGAELAEMVRSAAKVGRRPDRPKVLQIVPDRIAAADEKILGPPRRSPTGVRAEHSLTARERDVLKLLAQGKTVRATAAALGLSNKTVDAHKFNLMRKLGLHNKAELVMWAIQKKVVGFPANW